MAGHSKWKQIKRKKAVTDSRRASAWTKIIREITVAAKAGGGDPDGNPRLRLAIDSARAVNMPKENIERAVKKGTGELEGADYQEMMYEGYGPGGAAILVEATTDNANRTVAEVRHAFSKYGGNMGTEGSVAFQFRHCGQLIFAPGTNEDKVMEVALEAGADDVITDDDGAVEVLCAVADFEAVKTALEAAALKPDVAEVTMRPENEIELTGEDALRMQKLLDVIEDLDDVQAVYHNAAIDE
jgi:YebC/PmpR family DNA-binding regulatory protein